MQFLIRDYAVFVFDYKCYDDTQDRIVITTRYNILQSNMETNSLMSK